MILFCFSSEFLGTKVASSKVSRVPDHERLLSSVSCLKQVFTQKGLFLLFWLFYNFKGSQTQILILNHESYINGVFLSKTHPRITYKLDLEKKRTEIGLYAFE